MLALRSGTIPLPRQPRSTAGGSLLRKGIEVIDKAYQAFIEAKSQSGYNDGFKPLWIPDFLFDFQKSLLEWSIVKGRSATFADCGLGKTALQLAWGENIVRKTNKPGLILAPLSVTTQTADEAAKFGIEAQVSRDGQFTKKIVIANYERLHHFNWRDFEWVVCDESGCLKNFDGKIKNQITDFMRKIRYRALYTATAAPNDYIELGTSSEALGNMGYMDMLKMFFKADNDVMAHGGTKGGKRAKNVFGSKFRFRGHSEREFWRWVCSWARAVRKPSDLGFADGDFILPELITRQHVVSAKRGYSEYLFSLPAHGLKEQRKESRDTLTERCEMAAQLCQGFDGSIAWCNLNPEGDLLEKLIPDCVQVAGSDSLEKKEESFELFRTRKVKSLVSKVDIAGFGSNYQFINHETYFPSHSFEQWYQGIRRCWRFGQKRPVTVDVVTSEGQTNVLKNLLRKAHNSELMFEQLVSLMQNELKIERKDMFTEKEKLPKW